MTSSLTLICRLGAGLCLLDALIIMGSALAWGSGTTALISFGVALVYAGVAVVLLGLARAIRGLNAEENRLRFLGDTTELRRSMQRLTVWLLVASLAAGLFAGASLAAILQRMSEGFAVFG